MSSRARKREPDAESDSIDDHRSSKRTRGNVSKGNPNPNHADLLAGQGKLDSNGDIYWEISKARRLTISSFRGKTLVSIREYYEKDGHELPGKKNKGESIPRPQYDSDSKLTSENKEVGDDSGEYSDDKDTRRNIEATSEDDSDE
ncbi:hypothetical protein AtubIFM55763_004012 [Aspergillus tubingensis]|uniref:Transcriptional coactivator p15 (PC4) C-terminal domain-containing protein n=1 Tax=Aspergillus tubingensis TaxID=5068 RepID=A0A9W6ATQ2_ASPTU|nr:hypothetical protein AtubIFM54640_008729 [Aspergillus tubingensis]GLA73113.1 hypothetical protein AtubIFM55763_004012 [Aspergillus tubingensis]GLA85400.1 hypothetical protein AtubIFM56815_009636 [Aspergillus tubingensis]GLA97219.1 hypothetical protein AtubIFM57143_004709 [Aspergillus tubingensis]GLB20203.1 hypothetical protein AtubIFM61612_010130 [Aspergillus tubingensis]